MVGKSSLEISGKGVKVEKVFGSSDGIPKGKRMFVILLIAMSMQFFDYLTTKIAVNLNGGGAVEANPYARGLIIEGGFDYMLIFKLAFPLIVFFCMPRKFYMYDLMMVGLMIFGFLFVSLNNSMAILKILAAKHFGIWQPMAEGDIFFASVNGLFSYLGLGIMFCILGSYVLYRYKRLFLFGPAIICFSIVYFCIMNIR